jgi:membrane-bound lytic murein transglycosylase D
MGLTRLRFLPGRLAASAGLTLTLLAVAACGSSGRSGAPTLPDRSPSAASIPAPEPVAPLPPPEDPVDLLIARSNRHYDAGERELAQGHLDQARLEFDRAVDVLLESPHGARWDARLREHFDRLIDRINAREVMALAQGDGFTEKKYERASIDELLDVAMFARPVAVLSTREAVEAGLEFHDVPIPLNDRVLSYVELFQGRLREYMQDALSRGSQYLPMIQSVFRAEGLPLDLAYIPIVESAFKPNALSRAKAKGVWQFMRGTALENGLRHDWYIDERSDPEKATVAAAKYLKTLHRMFDGDWHLALASYNGGPGRVQRALKRFKADDFWTLSSRPKSLPRETREYVPMILAAIVIASNPAQFGIDFVPQDPSPTTRCGPARRRPPPRGGMDGHHDR